MSDPYYNDILYPIQDKVLEIMGMASSPFYLTGGTALSRFMIHHRYSDDLDFFVNRSPAFSQEADRLVDLLTGAFGQLEIPIREDSFVRMQVHDQLGNLLKIELINDIGFRVGEAIKMKAGFLIDTWENILTNKLSALPRNAAKDYIDILFICLNFKFNWETIIELTRQKDAWINEIAISKFLFDFDFLSLKEVKFTNSLNPQSIPKEYFKIIARDSLHGFDNSLYGRTLQ